MSSSFQLRFVFGLLVLCVFNSYFTEAGFRSILRRGPTSTSSGILPLPRIPITSASAVSAVSATRALNLPSSSQILHRRPMHASANSMTSVGLHARSSLSSSSSSVGSIHRAASSPSLNVPDSPSIMRESIISHRQAATALNLQPAPGRIGPNSWSSRMNPFANIDSLKLKSAGNIVKNIAIGLGGAGGALTVVKSISGGDENGNVNKEIGIITTTTTTTEKPKWDTPIADRK